MRFAVIQFGGSNCDRDALHVISDICGVDCDLVWYKDGLSRPYDAVILPGGFSYGDYLRAGAIAARTPVMNDVIAHAKRGHLVLGICNGAQILAESGLVPGVFTINAYPKFICRSVHLRVETHGFAVYVPVPERRRNQDPHRPQGREVCGPGRPAVSDSMVQDGLHSASAMPSGTLTPESNPNGAIEHITGVLNETRNVLAMMPHPERASEEILSSEDGKKVFMSMIAHIEQGKGVTC